MYRRSEAAFAIYARFYSAANTLRRRVIQRAGRLIRPQGWLTLSMNANQAVQNELLHYLDEIEKAA